MQSILVRILIRVAGSVWFLPAVVLCLFREILLGQTRFSFRDVSHFYTPLYAYIARRQQNEWLPLWNPLDQTGVPLVGESTTALFYPLRWLVYAIPTDAGHQVSLYVLVHLVIAAMSMRWAAIRLLASPISVGTPSASVRMAANGAGLLYALSGSVLFLACNPPFLVGAAWLPIAIAIVAGRTTPSLLESTIAAVALDWMVLAGDPQTALHVMMVGAVVWLLRRGYERRDLVLRLLLPPLLAACLAAPQIAGSLDWVRHSNRGVDSSATRSQAFDYATPPWHALEVLSPMPFGELLPVHGRWSQALPGDGRMWTPTIYAGALAGLALIGGWSNRRQRTWWWVAVFGWSASMGPFGLCWLMQNVGLVTMDHDSSIGGVYWWLYTIVPGYDSFRYPSKWLPVLAFGLSVVASDWLVCFPRRTLRKMIVSIASIQVAIWLISFSRFNPVDIAISQLGTPSPDSFWGPFQIDFAKTSLRGSLQHSVLAFAALAGTLVVVRSRCRRRTCVAVMLVVATLDLGFANHDLVPVVPTAESRLSDASWQTVRGSDEDPGDKSTRLMRTRAGSEWPPQWRQTSSSNRLKAVEDAAIRTRWMRWHLHYNERLFNGPTSIRASAMDRFWMRWRKEAKDGTAGDRREFWQSARELYGIGGELHITDGNVTMVNHLTTGSDAEEWGLKSFAGGPLRRAVFQDGNWSVRWRHTGQPNWNRAEVHSVEGLCQEVDLPAGDLQVQFDYWPWWQSFVVELAAIGWLSVLVCWIRAVITPVTCVITRE